MAEKRNLSSGRSARPEVCNKVELCLLPPLLQKRATVQLQLNTPFSRTPALPPVALLEGAFLMKCWMAAAACQRRLVPEGVGLFSETDWQRSPYVSWEVKLDSALSITIKAIPTCSLNSSYTLWSKTTAMFNCLFSNFHSGSCFSSSYLSVGSHCHRKPDCDWVGSMVWVKCICQLSSMVQTWLASFCASGQTPIFVVNCLNSSSKSCCSDDLCVLLC